MYLFGELSISVHQVCFQHLKWKLIEKNKVLLNLIYKDGDEDQVVRVCFFFLKEVK